LFEVVEVEEIGAMKAEVQAAVTDLARFSKIVKLKAFQVSPAAVGQWKFPRPPLCPNGAGVHERRECAGQHQRHQRGHPERRPVGLPYSQPAGAAQKGQGAQVVPGRDRPQDRQRDRGGRRPARQLQRHHHGDRARHPGALPPLRARSGVGCAREGAAGSGAQLQPCQGEVQREPQRQHDHPGHRAAGPAGQGHQHLRHACSRVVRPPLSRGEAASEGSADLWHACHRTPLACALVCSWAAS